MSNSINLPSPAKAYYYDLIGFGKSAKYNQTMVDEYTGEKGWVLVVTPDVLDLHLSFYRRYGRSKSVDAYDLLVDYFSLSGEGDDLLAMSFDDSSYCSPVYTDQTDEEIVGVDEFVDVDWKKVRSHIERPLLGYEWRQRERGLV